MVSHFSPGFCGRDSLCAALVVSHALTNLSVIVTLLRSVFSVYSLCCPGTRDDCYQLSATRVSLEYKFGDDCPLESQP